MADRGPASPPPPAPLVGNGDSLYKCTENDPLSGEAIPLTSEPEQTFDGNGCTEVRPGTVDSSTTQDSRKVITGLPRSQTFKRRLSEQRSHLEPVPSSADERRAISMDRRYAELTKGIRVSPHDDFHDLMGPDDTPFDVSAPDYTLDLPTAHGKYRLSDQSIETASLGSISRRGDVPSTDVFSAMELVSPTSSQHEATIAEELEQKWILNLSMHFRDRSNREKFFVTYREDGNTWRRVTISVDYRNAPANSLEMELMQTRYQRDKNSKIYEAIRDSLTDIQFYDSVTNLKLETTDGRLHVHVVEDGNEIIHYPMVNQVEHLKCRRIRERDISFDSHMSGFVYKVHVEGRVLIKKEIPSPDTTEQFLYEVNALHTLRYAEDIVQLYGVVVDDHDEHVKGLLISYAEQGALIDIIYDNCKDLTNGIPWLTRQKWARQIVQGLADIHESGFVQGDFTLSNIVVDANCNAKIIDINRRGCPVGWEPPEATSLVAAYQRINMFIGVKSDLYQLGMVLWGLAMLEDEPETHGRPLVLGPEVNIPDWYRQITEICLSADPRVRLQASSLLHMFPPDTDGRSRPMITVDDTHSLDDYTVKYPIDTPRHQAYTRTVQPTIRWPNSRTNPNDPNSDMYESYYYPTRGRSPPSPLPSHVNGCESPDKVVSSTSWAANNSVRPSYSDVDEDDVNTEDNSIDAELRPETPLSLGNSHVDSAAYLPTDVRLEEISPRRVAMMTMEKGASPGLGPHNALQMPRLARNDTAIHMTANDARESLYASEKRQDLKEPTLKLRSKDEDTRFEAKVDAHAYKTTESEVDGGVALELAAELPLRRLPMSEIAPSAKENNSTEPKGYRSPSNMSFSAGRKELVQSTTETGQTTKGHMPRRTALAEADTKMQYTTETRLGDFLKSPTRSNILQNSDKFHRQSSLPLKLTGNGAGLGCDKDTVNLKQQAAIEGEFNAIEWPVTVQALMVATDSRS